MITILASQSYALPQYAVSFVEIVNERTGEAVVGFQVGTAGPIFRDYPAAERNANARRERDARIAQRQQDRAAAVRVMASAAQRAGVGVARRGVAQVGGVAANRPARVFGAGLGV